MENQIIETGCPGQRTFVAIKPEEFLLRSSSVITEFARDPGPANLI
jgi:hypothetical protein